MMRLSVVGAGGHGRVVAESAAACGWDVSFLDDARTGQVDGWPILGKSEDALLTLHGSVIVAIGNNRIRLDWLKRLRERGVAIATVIDPSALVSPSAQIGEGSFLARGAIVSTGARLGTGCIVNTAASIDHDCNLSDAVHLSPGVHLSGRVEIGECSWVGTGCSVRNHLSIGHDVIVGVGSVVIGDISSNQTVAGIPARLLEKS